MIHPDAQSDDKNSIIAGSVLTASTSPPSYSQATPLTPTLHSVDEEKQLFPFLGFRLHHYPFSLLVLTCWVAFTVLLIVNLEGAARVAAGNSSMPWYYRDLPDIMSTIFAQGHVAVTAMHLSRLAIGTLHSSSTSPRTYAELFWSADRKWSGPLGILSCTVGMFKLRTRVSVTFILFAITCLLAISTPLLLNAAYPHTTVEIESLILVKPSTASPARMKTVSMYNQLSTGSGQWATGLPILSMNGGSIYLSDEVELDEEEMFFAGDSQGMDMSLPGIRLLGSCKVMEDHQNDTSSDSLSQFNKLCGMQRMSLDNGTYAIYYPMGTNTVIKYQSCFDSDFSNIPPPNSTSYSSSSTFSYPSLSKMAANFWFRSTSGDDDGDDQPNTVGGIIRCESTMIFGIAEVKGSSKRFIAETFEEQDLIGDDYVADIPPVHPLWAVFQTLNYPQAMNLMQNPFYIQTWLAQMGYMCDSTYGSASPITQPSLQQLSDHLSYGIAYMANAITILSVSSDEWYPAVVHVDKVSRGRSPKFIAVTFVVLGLWFMSLAVLTAKMYRPTFGDGLNSYVVSRLLADDPSVLEGHGCGGITKNKLLTAEFRRIGDGRGEEKVGHIRAGGQTLLSTNRRYA